VLTAALVTAALSGAAAGVAASPGESPLVRSGLARPPPRSRAHRSASAVAVALLALIGGADPLWWSAAAVSLVAVALVTRIWRAQRDRAEAARTRAMVLEVCESLVAELRAGRPPQLALELGMGVMPALANVAAAARLGGDVPDALRQLARRPGARALHSVAAGWQIAARTGASLAGVVEHVVAGIRDDEAARGEVEASLGPPRATARLLALLPAAGIALGSSIGADPVHVLLLTTFGHVCLGVGVILALLGLTWVERIAATVGDTP
jgi:tight adherence protein B